VIRKVTKFRPGEATNTSARSIVFTDQAPLGDGSTEQSRRAGVAVLVYKHPSVSSSRLMY